MFPISADAERGQSLAEKVNQKAASPKGMPSLTFTIRIPAREPMIYSVYAAGELPALATERV
jgi:hypothetical protein